MKETRRIMWTKKMSMNKGDDCGRRRSVWMIVNERDEKSVDERDECKKIYINSKKGNL